MIDIFSYIDPGTGAIILQVLAGIFIALGVIFGIWWKKITTFIKGLWVKLFGKDKKDAATDDARDEIEDTEESGAPDNANDEVGDTEETGAPADKTPGQTPDNTDEEIARKDDSEESL